MVTNWCLGSWKRIRTCQGAFSLSKLVPAYRHVRIGIAENLDWEDVQWSQSGRLDSWERIRTLPGFIFYPS